MPITSPSTNTGKTDTGRSGSRKRVFEVTVMVRGTKRKPLHCDLIIRQKSEKGPSDMRATQGLNMVHQ